VHGKVFLVDAFVQLVISPSVSNNEDFVTRVRKKCLVLLSKRVASCSHSLYQRLEPIQQNLSEKEIIKERIQRKDFCLSILKKLVHLLTETLSSLYNTPSAKAL
jgi:hypothetical protein